MPALVLTRSAESAARLERLQVRALSAELGTLLSYDELFDLAELRPNVANPIEVLKAKQTIYQMVRQVNRDLLAAKRLLVNRYRQGFLLAEAPAHLAHAKWRQRKGTRQYRQALDEFRGVDLTQLSPRDQADTTLRVSQLETLLAIARKRSAAGIRATEQSLSHQRAVAAQLEVMTQQLETMRQLFRGVS